MKKNTELNYYKVNAGHIIVGSLLILSSIYLYNQHTNPPQSILPPMNYPTEGWGGLFFNFDWLIWFPITGSFLIGAYLILTTPLFLWAKTEKPR